MQHPKYNIRITGALGCLAILLPLIITAALASAITLILCTW